MMNGWSQAIVDLSGKIALVGVIDFDEREGPQDKYIDDGVVLAYHQNDFGFWEQTEYPFIHSTTYVEFGQNIDIDDDLACVY